MKRKVFFVFFICVLFILSSCGDRPEPSTGIDAYELTYTPMPVLLSESEDSIGASYGSNKTLELTKRNNITYAFESKVSKEDRVRCIQTTEMIINRIGADKELQINVYTTETYGHTFVKEGTVYTYLQDWKTPEYISCLLCGIFGEYCNYGAIYGYAAVLCNELFELPLLTCGEELDYEGGLNFLDLNLLCFRPEFVSAEDIENAKKISNSFVSGYIGENDETEFQKILAKSGDPDEVDLFNEALAVFYESRNIEYTPTKILYRLGGRSYDYIVKCNYAVMYVEKDWFDANKDLCPFTYDGFLHQDYNDVKQYFTINIEEMGQYRELFKLQPYDDDLNIYFTNHYGRKSCYLAATHSIVAYNTASLGHEYIHSLTSGHNLLELWAHEGFARYFSYYYNHYGNAMSTVDYNTTPINCIVEYREKLGRDIDMSKDFAETFHIMTYSYDFDDPNDGDGYIAGASFIDYLISRFGEDKVVEIICRTHDFGEYTYSELVTDWAVFIQDNYSDYSKR